MSRKTTTEIECGYDTCDKCRFLDLQWSTPQCQLFVEENGNFVRLQCTFDARAGKTIINRCAQCVRGELR